MDINFPFWPMFAVIAIVFCGPALIVGVVTQWMVSDLRVSAAAGGLAGVMAVFVAWVWMS